MDVIVNAVSICAFESAHRGAPSEMTPTSTVGNCNGINAQILYVLPINPNTI